MTERKSVAAYPLEWPEGWPRTKFVGTSKFKTATDKARRKLLNEISLMGGTSPVINAVVPFGVTGSTATIVATVNGTLSNSVQVPLAATAPGIFSVPPNGISGGAMRHLDGTLVSATAPASRNEFISVYLTGLGATNPAVGDGAAAPGAEPLARITGPVAVYVGGQPVTNVQFAGLAPTFAGLYQLNIQIPIAIASGAQSLAVQTNEGFTDMVTIWIH